MARIASEVASSLRCGDVVLLYGDLGVGKTFFSGLLINSLSQLNHVVTSPTFNIMQQYEVDRFTVYHYDLYRLQNAEELWQLGLDEALNNGVAIIEWPDVARHLLPKNCIEIRLSFSADPLERELSINNG